MIRKELLKYTVQLKNQRTLLQDRCALLQVSCTSKYSVTSKKDKNKQIEENEEFDKPIKFSTSKAATYPAAYTIAANRGVPWFQGPVVLLSMAIFMIYFGILREENDIDENMTKNIPPEILEQIYGKHRVSKNKEQC